MEGHIYHCEWKRSRGVYTLYLSERSDICAEAKDFSEASELLAEKICTEYGDGEAVLNFNPQPPIESQLKIWTTPKILAFGYNERVDSNIKEAGMYADGFCPKCGFAKGMRSAKPLVISGRISSHITWVSGSRPALLLFSEKLLNLFHQEELKALTIKPVQCVGKFHARFFEVSGGADIQLVSFRDAEHKPITNWKCSSCSRLSLAPFHQRFFGTGINKFIHKGDLPNPLQSLFTVGLSKNDVTVCVTGERWQELKGEPEAKKIIVNTVGIVHERELVRHPMIEHDYPS